MATSTKLVLLVLFGALMGVVVLFLIGWLYAKGSLFSPVMTWLYWNDLIIPAAILGALTCPFFFTIVEGRLVIQTSSPKKFLIGLFLLITVGSFFSWQRNRNLQEIDNRYIEFCTLLGKKDYTTAYTYMSPTYQQTVPFSKFPQQMNENGSHSSFADMCSYSLSGYIHTYATIIGNNGSIDTNIDFYDILAQGTSIRLEKIDSQWYFSSEPNNHGID